MKPVVISIDPGLRHMGIALFVDSTLVKCALLKAPGKDKGVSAWSRIAYEAKKFVLCDDSWQRMIQSQTFTSLESGLAVVSEYPQSYSAEHQKGDQNDLIELAGVVAYTLGSIEAGEKVTYLPRDWKGTVLKDVMCQRIVGRLGDSERELVGLANDDHNVLDAVGVGLHYLGRLAPKKVFLHE